MSGHGQNVLGKCVLNVIDGGFYGGCGVHEFMVIHGYSTAHYGHGCGVSISSRSREIVQRFIKTSSFTVLVPGEVLRRVIVALNQGRYAHVSLRGGVDGRGE